MRLTKELLTNTYNHFNDYIFGGELPDDTEIRAYSSKINCGFFEGSYNDDGEKEYLIKISDRYNKTYGEFCETMVHEMIHVFQFLRDIPVDHGKTFKAMARTIKREIGLDIR